MTDRGPLPCPGGTADAVEGPDLSVDQARAAMLAAVAAAPALPTENVPLDQALGRVLAADLPAGMDVPPHDNSAMDGYAFDGAALRPGAALRLRCVATVLAGPPWPGVLGPGEAVRIMTGAVMPAGCDTVVPQELCSVESGAEGGRLWLHIPPDVVCPGDNRRRRGEDLQRGHSALAAGRVLRPSDLGLAASLGHARLTVRRRLTVALVSTGNELQAPGTPLAGGGIYDSNRASLRAALQRLGLEVLDLGLVPDEPAALRAVLARALAEADVLLSSGGASAGEADHTRSVLGGLVGAGSLDGIGFWKVAMRPGRPFAFGPLRGGPSDQRTHWLFALPGNPVAALVSFYMLVREPLLALAGARPEPLPAVWLPSAGPIRKRVGRSEFQRGIVAPGADGRLQVALTGAQGAGILRSLSQANALVLLAPERGPVAAGELVPVWLFDGLV